MLIILFAFLSLTNAQGNNQHSRPIGHEKQHQRPEGNNGHRNNKGPWNRDLAISTSKNGRHFSKSKIFFPRGGVPNIIKNKEGHLLAAFQWFSMDYFKSFDKVAISVSKDQGDTWSIPKEVVFNGLSENLMRPFDPTLLLLPDGRIRMYFTSNTLLRGRVNGAPAIYSAISSDGFTYQIEDGVRLQVENKKVIDCAVAYFKGKYHLISPVNKEKGTAYYAISNDGLNFELQKNLKLGNNNWLGAMIVIDDTLFFYGTGKGGWIAKTSNGKDWTLLDDTRYHGADPGVVQVSNSHFILLSTGALTSYPLQSNPKKKNQRKMQKKKHHFFKN